MAIVIPSSIYQATPTEKAQLYNSLLGQGYSDEEIRVAAGAPRDDNWALLQSIAQSLQPVESLLDAGVQDIGIADQDLAQQYEPVIYESYTPLVIEEQYIEPPQEAAPVEYVEPITQAPQSIFYAPGFEPASIPEPVATPVAEGLLSTQTEAPVAKVQAQANRLDLQSLVTPEDAANIRMASDIGAAYPIVRGNEVYSFNPDGSVEYTRMNPGGVGATIGLYSSTGEEIVPQYYNADFGKTSTATRLLQAGLAAGIGGILGPAGAGLLSAPVAAATGAGLTSYGVTGDLESALKAAALGGATAFGIETLFPTAVQTAANTAVDLAGTGASQTEIVNALVDQGVRAGTAAQIAGDALAGATARQIATDFAGASIGGTAAGATSLAPNVVEVLGSTAAPGLLATAAPSLASATGGLLGAQVPAQQAPAVVAQTVPVTSSAAPVELQSIAPAAVGGALTQTVPVQAATIPAQTQATAPTAAAVGGLLAPAQTVPVQATNIPAQTQPTAPTAAAVGTLAPTQTVQVEDRPIKREEAQILTPVAAGTVAGVPVADVTVPRSSTGPIEGSTTINPLLALGLLGLAGTALAGGGSTAAPFDQAAYDAIAKGRSPVYPRGDFVPAFGPGGRGMFQIAPTDVYNYFGPPYGAGRFGAVVQPFTLPGEAPQTDARAEERRFIASAPTSLLGSPSQANRAAGLLDTGTMRQPQSARTTQAAPQTQEDLVARLRAAREAAGLPSDPTKWTNADRVKAAEIQNEIQGLGEFGSLVVNPETGVTSRTPVQMFSTLPEDQRARVSNYLSAVVPIVADRALSSGGGWNELTMLSNQYRVNPNELLGFMSPDQRTQFQDKFGYQLEGPATNTRLFGSPLSISNLTGTIGGQPTFTPEFSPYLEQAASLLPNASPETQAYLRQAIYSGATQGDFGGIPLDPSQYQNFGVPWWQQSTKLGQGIEALASGDPTQFYRQQALQRAQGPLSNVFSDAATRMNYGSIGGFDVTASRDLTPYIEDINLYGSQPIARLREQYGLSDQQIGGLLDLVPTQNLVVGTDNFGRPVYTGDIGQFMAQRMRVPGGGFTGSEIIAMSREGLPPPGP